jgi:hypothetical protein
MPPIRSQTDAIALNIVEHARSFDLVVMDVMMPEILRFEHMRGLKTPDGAGALAAVTKPTPDETCGRCGSLLFPPDLAPGMMIPAAADLVCLNCGRAYEWTGTPPRLCVVVPDVESDEDEGDD